MIKTTRNTLACIFLLCALAPAAERQSSLTLPTPRDHYKTYEVQRAKFELIAKVIKDFEPQILKLVEFVDPRAKTENLPPTESEDPLKSLGDADLESMTKVLNGIDPETRKRVAESAPSGAEVGDSPQLNVVQLARATGLAKYKADILETVPHSSDVLAVVPKESFDTYGPIIHDLLLAFLDGLPDERILDRALALARAPDASRGEKSLVFASKITTLQKVGQVIARMEDIPPDTEQSQQTLETGMQAMTRDELVSYIEEDVGGEVLRKYDAQFDDRTIAEASAGAATDGSFQPSGQPKQQSVNKQPIRSRLKRFAQAFVVRFIAGALNHRPD